MVGARHSENNLMSVEFDIKNHKKIVKRTDGSVFELYDEGYQDPWIVRRGTVLQPEVLKEILSKTSSN